MRSIRHRKSVILSALATSVRWNATKRCSMAAFNPGKPKAHLGLNFIQLAMHAPEHFMSEGFNVVGHGGFPVSHRPKVYHEAVVGSGVRS
jgi:hypothetical protein